jgi:hypothetical protein
LQHKIQKGILVWSEVKRSEVKWSEVKWSEMTCGQVSKYNETCEAVSKVGSLDLLRRRFHLMEKMGWRGIQICKNNVRLLGLNPCFFSNTVSQRVRTACNTSHKPDKQCIGKKDVVSNVIYIYTHTHTHTHVYIYIYILIYFNIISNIIILLINININ